VTEFDSTNNVVPGYPGQYTSTDNSAVAASELFTHERDWDVRGNPNIEKTAKPDSGGWDRLRPHSDCRL